MAAKFLPSVMGEGALMRRLFVLCALFAVAATPQAAQADPVCSITVCIEVGQDTQGTSCVSGAPGMLTCRIIANGFGTAQSRYGVDPIWPPGVLDVMTSIVSCTWTAPAGSGTCFSGPVHSAASTSWGGALLTGGATLTAINPAPEFSVPVGPGPCSFIQYTVAVTVHGRTEVAAQGSAVSEGIERTQTSNYGVGICSD